MTVRLRIASDHHEGWHVLVLAGELDLATTPLLRQAIVSVIAEGTNYLAIDATELEFVDSAGIGALIGGLKRARARGGELRLIGPGPALTALLELVELNHVLGIVASATALPAIAGAPA